MLIIILVVPTGVGFNRSLRSRTISTQEHGQLDFLQGCAGELRKATNIRHKGKKLEDILEAHAKYHKGQPGGKRADLSGANLSRVDFRKRDLTGALLVGCRLRGADFRGASGLTAAQVCSAHWRGALLDLDMQTAVQTQCPQ